jgi:hypothetical protein
MRTSIELYKLILIISLILLISCKDKSPNLSTIPEIKILDNSMDTVREFTDELTLIVQYTDNDGDLGQLSADSFSMEVWDDRLQKPDYYHVPPLAPIHQKIKINGDLQLTLKNLFRLSNAPIESTRFKIRLKDRAHQWSNIAISKPIYIIKHP